MGVRSRLPASPARSKGANRRNLVLMLEVKSWSRSAIVTLR